jgi:hypothetical protein
MEAWAVHSSAFSRLVFDLQEVPSKVEMKIEVPVRPGDYSASASVHRGKYQTGGTEKPSMGVASLRDLLKPGAQKRHHRHHP